MRNRVQRRRASSLAEVMVAVALVAALGMSLMTLVSGGAQVGARAGEMQMASMVGARVIDRMVAIGYQGLERKRARSGEDGQLDLATLDTRWRRPEGAGGGAERGGRGDRDPNRGDQLDPETRETRTLTVDGFTYFGRYSLAPVEQGLLKVGVTIYWERYGVTSPRHPGSIELMRYVADALVDPARVDAGGAAREQP